MRKPTFICPKCGKTKGSTKAVEKRANRWCTSCWAKFKRGQKKTGDS